LNALGAPAEIATLSFSDDLPWSGKTPIHWFPWASPKKLLLSPGLRTFLHAEVQRFDVVQVHGLWEWPALYARQASQAWGRPLVISPRGMIEPWSLAQNRWLKRIAMKLWERKNLESAALFHATSASEARSLRMQGLVQPIAVVPNGIRPAPLQAASGSKFSPTYALFLSRLHPKKGLDLLLKAWAESVSFFPDWKLFIAGPDEGDYGVKMRALAESLGLRAPQVQFMGEVHGEEKRHLLAGASVLLLPSHSENFGNVVLEALNQGTPVLTTHGTPWAELVTHHCGWWVPLDEFGQALRSVLATPRETLASMGQQGAQWAREAFDWSHAASALAQDYEWLLGRGPIPANVEEFR
jgi:glycosyltransferase involved in cell wall biosynthesis